MPNQTLTAPRGFKVAAVKAGIKPSGKLDLGLIVADEPCPAAAVFTTNKVVAPAVLVSREHIRSGRARAVFVNAGNANTCTGPRGEKDVQMICKVVAATTGATIDEVLVCSTGIIGQYLPMHNVKRGIARAAARLSRSAAAGQDLARAIMTTDTRLKLAGRNITLHRKPVRIAGIAKGSGMIEPNLATMLAFLTTDAAISPALLRRALKEAANLTFNKISIDKHMSTSDTAIVLASGRAGNDTITKTGPAYDRFVRALWQVCDDLARQMAADGEGATCMVTVKVTGAASTSQARSALRCIVDSPLVRTAFHGADPNWGRIVSAVGFSGARFAPYKLTCKIAGVCVYRSGMPARFNAAALSKKMKASTWQVDVDLGVGSASDFCYTCDLSRRYVAINADYHT